MRPIVAETMSALALSLSLSLFRSLGLAKGVENESSRVESESSGEDLRKRGVEVAAAFLVKEREEKRRTNYITHRKKSTTRAAPASFHPSASVRE